METPNIFEQIFTQLNRIETKLEGIPHGKNERVHGAKKRLTRKDIREEYAVSYGTIHNLMKKGQLPFEKIGRKTLFTREDVENCFQSRRKVVI